MPTLNRRVTRLRALLVAPLLGILVSSCGADDPALAPTPKPTLSVSPRSVSIGIGSDLQLTAVTSAPGGAAALRWESSFPEAVTVSATGVVRAHAAAYATIRVWLADDPTVRDSAAVVPMSGAAR